jgi:hypothetical protein
MITALKLVEAIMGEWDWDEPHVILEVEGLTVHASWVDGTDEDPLTLTLDVHNGLEMADSSAYRNLAYDTVSMWYSEATNDDACDIEVREVSAHLDTNPLTAHISVTDQAIVIIARVHDAMS